MLNVLLVASDSVDDCVATATAGGAGGCSTGAGVVVATATAGGVAGATDPRGFLGGCAFDWQAATETSAAGDVTSAALKAPDPWLPGGCLGPT